MAMATFLVFALSKISAVQQWVEETDILDMLYPSPSAPSRMVQKDKRKDKSA